MNLDDTSRKKVKTGGLRIRDFALKTQIIPWFILFKKEGSFFFPIFLFSLKAKPFELNSQNKEFHVSDIWLKKLPKERCVFSLKRIYPGIKVLQ